MPVYEYYCRHCRKTFTDLMSVKEHDERSEKCPVCHESKDVEKRISNIHVVTTKKWVTY